MARTREAIQTDAGTETANTTDKRKRRRVSVFLNDDNTPDWGAVPEEQRAMLGMGGATIAAEPAPEPLQVPPAAISILYQSLISIESALLAPRFNMERETVHAIMTPPEPLFDGLVDATGKVLAKYGGTMGRYQDEIVLATLLISWQASAFGQLRQLKAANEAAKAEPAPPSLERRESMELKTAARRGKTGPQAVDAAPVEGV